MLSGMSKGLSRSVLCAALAASLLVCTAMLPTIASAKGAKAAERAALADSQKCRGKVTAVDATAGTITIHSKKDGDMTLAVDSSTKIKVNKESASLADVKVGMGAMMRTNDKKTALTVNAHDAKEKNK